ncbi:MAG TPA: hypothetical protein VHP32_01755 [Ignavibacteria bacterium]|nr:hypothetical protein [Ignavibacteria bacterium]
MKQLLNLTTGVKKHLNTWPLSNGPTPDSIAEVTSHIKNLTDEITVRENELTEKRRELNKFINEHAKTMYVKVRDQIYSIHGKRSEKLKDFGLKSLNNKN